MYSDEAMMNKMRTEIARLQSELTHSKQESARVILEKEIALKESQFLRARMRPEMVPKIDRRQTWHHEMQDQDLDTTLMPPPGSGKLIK